MPYKKTECVKFKQAFIKQGWKEISKVDYAKKKQEPNSSSKYEFKSLDCVQMDDLFFYKEKTPVVSSTPPVAPPVVPPVTPPVASGSIPPPPPPTPRPVCPYPSTNFSTRDEGNEFRQFMNDNFNSYAKSIRLDVRGPKDNCNFIRKAYATTPSGYELSYGELFLKSKENPNWKVDYTKENYQAYQEKQKIEKIYTSDKKMWEDLIVKKQVPNAGIIKQLSSGAAVYILKVKKGTESVYSISPFEKQDLENSINLLIPSLESGEWNYYAFLPPADRNVKPLKGSIGKIDVGVDPNNEKYVKVVKTWKEGDKTISGLYWDAFELGDTFMKESIIKDILKLIKEEGEPTFKKPSFNQNPVGSTTGIVGSGSQQNTGGPVGTIAGVTGGQNTSQQGSTQQGLEKKNDTQACISEFSGLTREQNIDLNAFLQVNSGYTKTVGDTGRYTKVPVNKLEYPKNSPDEQVRVGVRREPAICDTLVLYKRDMIQGVKPDQVGALETLINTFGSVAEISGFTFDQGSILTDFTNKQIPYDMTVIDYFSPDYVKYYKLETVKSVPLYLKDGSQWARSKNDTKECRKAVKRLYNCIAGRGAEEGVPDADTEDRKINCGNPVDVMKNKTLVYFCDKRGYGNGKLFMGLGLGKEWEVIKGDTYANTPYSVNRLITRKKSLSENNLKNTINKIVSESIKSKNTNGLGDTIKNNLLSEIRKKNNL